MLRFEEMEKKLESNKKELQSLVAGLEEKFGSGGGEEVKKGAEAQIMKKARVPPSHVTSTFGKREILFNFFV